MRSSRWVALLMLLFVALALGACGGDDDDSGGDNASSSAEQAPTAGHPEERPERVDQARHRVEELHRAEGARGDLRPGARRRRLRVSTELNLGDEKTALKALEQGDISAYPEYTGTALLSFFGYTADKIPKDGLVAYSKAKEGFAKKDLTARAAHPVRELERGGA